MFGVTLRESPLATSLLALTAFGCSNGASAFEVGDRLNINGYGHTSYFRADGTTSWDDSLASILFSAPISEETTVWLQIHNTTRFSHLDWAFADYRPKPGWLFRAGQIKLPVGLYNEIIDCRFLQMSTQVPILYQDAAGFVDENYRGIYASYSRDLAVGGIAVNVYGGEVAPSPDTPDTTRFHDLAGVTLKYTAPIDGLSFSYSGYSSRLEQRDTNLPAVGKGHKRVQILSESYEPTNWDVKAEVGHTDYLNQHITDGYVQLGRRVAQRWIPFVRLERISFKAGGDSDQRHQSTATAGTSFLLNNSILVRAEGGRSRGFALPYFDWLTSNPGGALDPTTMPSDRNWNFFSLSVCFIF